MGEFDLIERIRLRAGAGAAGPDSGVVLGIGDDAAVLRPSPGHQLVATTDSLNTGIHFDPGVSPEALGHKSLAVNLSDLAAMGATPRWALLSLSMPRADTGWLDAFIAGFLDLAGTHGVALVGGDTCAGSLSVTVTALGEIPAGAGLERGGAKPGELVMVSGFLGDAAKALADRLGGDTPDMAQADALDRPVPRVALGASLVGKASSCIDISDGLLADLGHIATASGCGAEIELAKLPCSDGLAGLEAQQRWSLQVTGGEDYELCFTVPPDSREEMAELSARLGISLTEVGRMTGGSGVRCVEPGGGFFQPRAKGFDHFE